MNALNALKRPPSSACCEQVYLIERDAGLLCRILGLYAARALEVLQVDYAYAAQQVMSLRVRVSDDSLEADALADTVRVLVARVSTWVGVIAATELVEPARPLQEAA